MTIYIPPDLHFCLAEDVGHVLVQPFELVPHAIRKLLDILLDELVRLISLVLHPLRRAHRHRFPSRRHFCRIVQCCCARCYAAFGSSLCASRVGANCSTLSMLVSCTWSKMAGNVVVRRVRVVVVGGCRCEARVDRHCCFGCQLRNERPASECT